MRGGIKIIFYLFLYSQKDCIKIVLFILLLIISDCYKLFINVIDSIVYTFENIIALNTLLRKQDISKYIFIKENIMN